MAKKATILEVAKIANVSIATVSRVLNNPETVKEATRQKVEHAFTETGYVVDPAPEENRETIIKTERKDNRMILTIVPDSNNPFYPNVLDGISATANYQGYDTVRYSIQESRYTYEQLKQLVDRLNVSGIILLGKVAAPQDLEKLNEYVPIVQCAEFDAACNLPYVSIDDYAAAKAAMKLLLQSGRKKIALANGPQQYKYATDRERGYYDALQEFCIAPDDALVVHQSAIEFELAMSTMTQLLTKRPDVDAIFAVSDVLAVAAIKAVTRAGRRVPEDVAVIGFDNTYLSLMSEPPLTTVRQRGGQMGAYACEMLLDLIRGSEVSHPQILMDADLIVREST